MDQDSGERNHANPRRCFRLDAIAPGIRPETSGLSVGKPSRESCGAVSPLRSRIGCTGSNKVTLQPLTLQIPASSW